jgi:hypothetical protein
MIPVELKKSLAIEVAIRSLSGDKQIKIARDLKIKRQDVAILLKSKECRAALAKLDEEALSSARRMIRYRISNLTPKIINALERAVRSNNMKGVEISLKVLNVLNPENDDSKQAQQMTLIMPGAKPPVKDIEINGNQDVADTDNSRT